MWAAPSFRSKIIIVPVEKKESDKTYFDSYKAQKDFFWASKTITLCTFNDYLVLLMTILFFFYFEVTKGLGHHYARGRVPSLIQIIIATYTLYIYI